MYLREANLAISKSWYSLGEYEHKYPKIEDVREYSQPWTYPKSSKDDTRVARLFLRLDDRKEFTEITLYGILQLFSELGGIWAGMMSVGTMLAFYVAYDFFIANLMSSLFEVRGLDPRCSGDPGDDDKGRPPSERSMLTPTDEQAKDYKRLQKRHYVHDKIVA